MVTVENETKLYNDQHHLEKMYMDFFPSIARYVKHWGGTLEDAKDLFHDALIIFLERSQSSSCIQKDPYAYLVGIVKHLWIKQFHKNKNRVELTDWEHSIILPKDHSPTINQKRLLHMLEMTGKKCMTLLRAFYFNRISIPVITKKLGYANEHSASVQKYKCIHKLKNIIRKKSYRYEDFLD